VIGIIYNWDDVSMILDLIAGVPIHPQ